jgi:opacity protein-like surface antigen
VHASALAIMGLLAFTNASAAETSGASSGFYVAATLGRAEENASLSGIPIVAGFVFPPPSTIVPIYPDRIDSDSGQLSWNAAVGYRVNTHLAAELTYMHFGETEFNEHYDLSAVQLPFPVLPPIDVNRRFSSSVRGPAVSVLGSLPLGAGWDVFVRGGVLFADREIELRSPNNIGATTYGDEVWIAGGGVDWSFAQRWSVRAEYQRTGKLDANFIAGESYLEQLSLSVLFRL